MPDPKPPVAEMKRQLLARIADLRELTANPCGCKVYCAQHQIAHKIFRASLDAHEAFLKQECWDCHDHGKRQVPMNHSYGYVTEECPCGRPAQIQALYEALCGGESRG